MTFFANQCIIITRISKITEVEVKAVDVREFIEAIRKSRDMSFNEFSDTLEYKSKTSLSRLMRGESNLRSMESFCQRVKEHIDLTNEERRALTQIMQIARSGCSETAQEMEAFLRMDVTDETDINLEDNEGRIQTLAARYSGITGMSVLITNCHYVPIYPTICRWLRDQDAHVCHYMIIYDDPARTIHAITALLPIVYEKNYEGYAFKKPTERMVYGMQTADSMIVTYTAPDGGSHEDLILFDQTQHGRVLTADRPNISRMFSLPWTGYETIKRTYFQCTMLDDYLQYSEECAALERDCAQYIIESDPCVNMIPVSVLKAAFVDKCGDVDSHLLAQLVDVYERRFQNVNTEAYRDALHNEAQRADELRPHRSNAGSLLGNAPVHSRGTHTDSGKPDRAIGTQPVLPPVFSKGRGSAEGYTNMLLRGTRPADTGRADVIQSGQRSRG